MSPDAASPTTRPALELWRPNRTSYAVVGLVALSAFGAVLLYR